MYWILSLFEVEGRAAFGNHVFDGTSTRNAPTGTRWLWERMNPAFFAPLMEHVNARRHDTSASTRKERAAFFRGNGTKKQVSAGRISAE